MGSVSQAHVGVRGGEREEGERRQSCRVRKLRIKTPARTCEDLNQAFSQTKPKKWTHGPTGGFQEGKPHSFPPLTVILKRAGKFSGPISIPLSKTHELSLFWRLERRMAGDPKETIG